MEILFKFQYKWAMSINFKPVLVPFVEIVILTYIIWLVSDHNIDMSDGDDDPD